MDTKIQIHQTWPNRVVIGPGAAKTLGSEIKRLKLEKVLVITDNGMKGLDLYTDIVKMLEQDGLKVSCYSNFDPNPTDATISRAVDFMKDVKPEIIVAIGGGSPIDAAKCVNLLYTHGGEATEFDLMAGGMDKIENKLLPLIAVPTTAGTSSEVTGAAIIIDSKRKYKMTIASSYLIPEVSVIDAELTLGLPAGVTAATGMDALTHLIEGCVSNIEFPQALGNALYGIRMVSKTLRTAVHDGQNLKAREDMMMVCLISGISANTVLGLTHACAHQLSSFFDVPHGVANAIFLPHVMRFNMPVKMDVFSEIANSFGVDIRPLSPRAAAMKAVEEVEKLSRDIGIPIYLDEVGVKKEAIPEMVKNALVDPVIFCNPRTATAEEVTALYLGAFKPE